MITRSQRAMSETYESSDGTTASACLLPSRMWKVVLQLDRWSAAEWEHLAGCPRCRRRLTRALETSAAPPAKKKDPPAAPAAAAPPAEQAAGPDRDAAAPRVADLFAAGASADELVRQTGLSA